MKRVVSRDNADFKLLKKLCHSGRDRRKSNKIVLEGAHLVDAYMQRLGLPEMVVVSESRLGVAEIAGQLQYVAGQAPVILLEDSLFSELASLETPSGIMAVGPVPADAGMIAYDRDSVALDGVQDPGNVGSILRSAAAAGFSQVLLSSDCAHAWSPKVLRSAMGAHFLIDIHEMCDLPSFVRSFSGQVVVTEVAADRDLYAADLRTPSAWVFGSEGRGVRPDVAAAAKTHVRIPMPGSTESLNVAAAAAICLFETVRQRRN
jgi:TrmH family RNA methyltransferase